MPGSRVSEIRRDPNLHQNDCVICLVSLLQGGPLVAHEGSDGARHPIHRSCFDRLVQNNNSRCPSCRSDIDLSSFLSVIDTVQRYASIAFGYLSQAIKFCLISSGMLSVSAINLLSIALVLEASTMETLGLLVGSTVFICFITEMHALLSAAIKGAETGAKTLLNRRQEMLANGHQVNQIAGKTFLVGAMHGAWKGIKYEFSKNKFDNYGVSGICTMTMQIAVKLLFIESFAIYVVAFTVVSLTSALLLFNVWEQIDNAITESEDVVRNYLTNPRTNVANRLLQA